LLVLGADATLLSISKKRESYSTAKTSTSFAHKQLAAIGNLHSLTFAAFLHHLNSCRNMKLSQFKFDLPLNLIAQNPTKRREDSRMMVVNRKNGHHGKQALQGYP
jgi:hypothetical protein